MSVVSSGHNQSWMTGWIFGTLRTEAFEWQIGHAAFTTGLLALGSFAAPLYVSAEVGLLLRFAAAVVAAIPCCFKVVTNRGGEETDSYSDQLVALAVLGALIGGEYAAAVLVPVIMDIGHYLEQRGIQGTQAAIAGLRELTAVHAILFDGTTEKQVSVDSLKNGDHVLIRPGDTVPADGEIVRGSSSLDESSLTGETTPRDVTTGDSIHAGTMNISGRIEIRVAATGESTALGRIRQLLAAAAQSRTPFIRMVERYAELYVPLVVLLAGAVFYQTRQMERVITVLVVSCPCALVLAGPAAMIAALATCSRNGILIRGTRFLESLATADAVAFDKTGTLTEGQLTVARIECRDGVDEREVLVAGAMCAAVSTHPVAQAVLQEARRRSIPIDADTHEQHESPGRGIELTSNGKTFRMGRPDWVVSAKMEAANHHAAIDDHVGPVVSIAVNDRWLGTILLSDQIRSESWQAISALRAQGIQRISMVTGDRRSAAIPVARALQLHVAVSESLPEEKLAFVRRESASGHRLIVVGDGINDSLALAGGDVGVAMGARGSDIAIQSSDIALMTNDLRRLPFAVSLARRTRTVVAQNIVLAAASSAIMLLLGALGVLTAVSGAVLHNAGTAFVIANSARLLRRSEAEQLLMNQHVPQNSEPGGSLSSEVTIS
ncbi:MAG: cation-translocating P-type ATPase [Planctomycetaceae bacterium]|nr:cation-translocating P-type ATPase [Planctomycetaceae bacterium]